MASDGNDRWQMLEASLDTRGMSTPDLDSGIIKGDDSVVSLKPLEGRERSLLRILDADWLHTTPLKSYSNGSLTEPHVLELTRCKELEVCLWVQ